MMIQEVVNILPTRVREGDIVLVEVAEDISEDRRFFIEATLADCAEEMKAHFMVFPEGMVHDLRSLSLEEMVQMRDLLEEFIEMVADRDAVGDA